MDEEDEELDRLDAPAREEPRPRPPVRRLGEMDDSES